MHSGWRVLCDVFQSLADGSQATDTSLRVNRRSHQCAGAVILPAILCLWPVAGSLAGTELTDPAGDVTESSSKTLIKDTADDEELDIALALADVLRAARSEIASQQSHINAVASEDKGLTGETVIALVAQRLTATGRQSLLELPVDSRKGRLIQAQFDAIREVIDQNQAVINRRDVGFKGFVPAVFARLVNERFDEKVGTEASVKVTAPLRLVRNRKSRPDTWEQAVIEGQFGSPDWPRGDLYAETTTLKQRKAFRVMVPEYYGQACLACHGDPKGSMDVTGYPKEGGQLDALGGSISIALFQ